MISRMSHATIFVNNQNEALEFYRDKLGLKVHTDAMVGEEFRWLTMCTHDDPDFEIILMEPKPGMLMDEESSQQLRSIMAKGVLTPATVEFSPPPGISSNGKPLPTSS